MESSPEEIDPGVLVRGAVSPGTQEGTTSWDTSNTAHAAGQKR